MLTDRNRIFLNLYGDLGAQLKHATARGDWVGTKDILAHDGKWITDQVTASGLRERGGTGLPIGEKWSLMPEPSDERQNYLVADADNREILRHEPHKLLEGCIYAGTAIGAKTAWIYARGEFAAETKKLIAAIDEAYATGLLGADAAGFDIRVHCGMDACIYGEESALLESLEGRKGMPRTVRTGLWGCPVMVDNIETLAMIP
ncbi:MAG: NADH-quinone oxidoreductase subunit F, partial [Pseudomonadota bacterium]|nr:NADH-quinone oxidoreductase subunit F [Pseudomonadota bacterium]